MTSRSTYDKGRSAPAATPQGGSLSRGLLILRILTASSRPQSLGDITHLTGLDQSTVHRLLRTMEEAGYVLRHPRTRNYMPSPAAYDSLPLQHPFRSLRVECRALLERTAQQMPFTIVLVLFQGAERVIVEIARSQNALVPYYSTWLTEPLHTNASGKLLLAARSREERVALIADLPLDGFAPRTLRDVAAIEQEIVAVQARGYATSLEEITEGLGAVAAPIRLDADVIGCVIATGLIEAIEAAGIESVGARLQALARLIPLQAGQLRAAHQFLGA